MITYEVDPAKGGIMYMIQSVFVVKEHRKKGIFTMAFRHIEELAKEDKDAVGIKLLVEKTNESAQGVY